MRRTTLALIAFMTMAANGFAAEPFEQSIRPLLRDYCVTCHSTEKQEGELDLQRFASIEQVKKQPEVWEHVLEQLSLGEMPPKDAKQLSVEQKRQLVSWVRSTLNEIALANAGDPGPVVLRRLSNHEYTYSLRDLTGVPSLDPAREFPVDGAAGEGFTNVGAALVMSPALLSKYLEAAKDVAEHLVLTPTGFRFSAGTSSRDATNETLANIREFYARYSDTGEQSVEEALLRLQRLTESWIDVYEQAFEGDATVAAAKQLQARNGRANRKLQVEVFLRQMELYQIKGDHLVKLLRQFLETTT